MNPVTLRPKVQRISVPKEELSFTPNLRNVRSNGVNQTVALRKLTGEERLEQAFLLSELVRELSISNIKKQLGPDATNTAIALELRRRLHQTHDRPTGHPH